MSGPSSSRRQSARAPRTTRPDNYYATNTNGDNTPTPTTDTSHTRSFPAIEHFTDSLAAVPHEMARHFTMVKEVEAKLHGPEHRLAHIAHEMAHLPPSTNSFQPTNGQLTSSHANEARRLSLNRELNHTILGMASTMDEKIAVLSAANLELSKWKDRMLSAYLQIPNEISSQARNGNPNHWAYVTDKETKKTGHERTRREAAASSVRGNPDLDPAAARSEARREAMIARRIRNQQQDSDFEERAMPKKQKGKGAKQTEAQAGEDGALSTNISATMPITQPKRKKTTATPGGERAVGTVPSSQKRPGSPTTEDKRKRKTAPGAAPAKKRFLNAGDFARMSLTSDRIQAGDGKGARPFSSPVIGTFSSVKEPVQKAAHSRGRHGSQTNAALALAENSKPKTTPALATPTVATAPDSPAVRPTVVDGPITTKSTSSEVVPPTAKTRQETLAAAMKREEPEAVEPKTKPIDNIKATIAPITTNAPAARSGRASKTATPVAGTFAETTARNNGNRAARKKEADSHASSESGRGDRPQRDKRKAIGTHKVANGDEADIDADADADEEGDDDEDEPRYCYCNGVSSGSMVACDNPSCEKQWFHLSCLGLHVAPATDKWYCDDCKPLANPRRGGRRD